MSLVNLGRIGLVLQGEWNGTTEYERLDVVTREGSSYACIEDHSNKQPPNSGYWVRIAKAGDSPDYEWSGTSIRFKDPSGTWGQFVDLKGEKGDTFTYDDLTDAQLSEIKAGLEGINNDAPDLDNSKTYRWGLRIQDGKTQFIYEEVI